MKSNRRNFVSSLAMASALPLINYEGLLMAAGTKGKRLKAGSTIGLVSPSGAIYENQAIEIAIESMQSMGLKVVESKTLRSRYGYLAGKDADRAKEINKMFKDKSIDGIIALRGGSGAARILDLLDYKAIARNPKPFIGYSDITALHMAIYSQCNMITFHGPIAASSWNDFNYNHFHKTVFLGESMKLENPRQINDRVVKYNRIRTIAGGKASGKILGGNLTVLTALAGTPYLPDFKGSILFLEDIGEAIYRIDRMLAQLRLCGILKQVSGVVLGQFADCKPGGSYGNLTLEEVFDDYLKPLKVPVFYGSMIGHISKQFTIPVGLLVTIDADKGTIEFNESAVA